MYKPFFFENFTEQVSLLEDPRVRRTRRHSLPLLIFCAMGALLTNGDSFCDMSLFARLHRRNLKRLFGMGNVPSHDTFNRLFQAVKPECLNDFLGLFGAALNSFAPSPQIPPGPPGEAPPPRIVALDGKTLRASASAAIPALHILNAWSSKNRLVIGQLATGSKSNEIKAAPELLKTLDVRGCVVTSDALNTQKSLAAQVVAQGADYLFPLKGNHPLAEEEIKTFMEDFAAGAPPGFQSVEKGHGRLETRRLWQSDEIAWFEDAGKWAGLRSFALLRCTREFSNGRRPPQTEQRLYLSSLGVNPAFTAEAARTHWGIESSCHWCLDMVFGEDRCRARTRNSAANLSALRKHCHNLLRSCDPPVDGKPLGLKARKYCASQDFNYLLRLISLSFTKPIPNNLDA
jgi:predicted transposase YbfD/YdcC